MEAWFLYYSILRKKASTSLSERIVTAVRQLKGPEKLHGLSSKSLPSHLSNLYPSSGVAVIVTVAPSLYVPDAAGVTKPPLEALTVRVY